MALKVFQNQMPWGTLDGVDSELTSLKGGEVVTLTSLAVPGTDKYAVDADGYLLPSSVVKRPAVTKTLTSGKRPLFLCDEGIAGYGTLFGSLVGGVVGQDTAGTVIGPHTTSGSGKVTLWDKVGFYGVTLDAVDTTASTGLVADNATLDSGSALYATAAGLLTPNAAAAFEAVVVARFISFESSQSFVTSNINMVQALNSPSGASALPKSLEFALIHWNPEV
ncbi:MAG: hypothetical protein LC122_13000 [Chitinophagales bacterium]|nr:hypothetical protein [Chitinophagales bacterium]